MNAYRAVVLASSVLLLGWEVMRLGWTKNARLRRLVSCSGLLLGVASLALMVIRFVVVQ